MLNYYRNNSIMSHLHLSIIFTLFLIPASSSLSFNMSSISYSDINSFNVTGDAYISDQGIQVTPNDGAGAGSVQAAGRATHTEALHLWDKASRNMTDFSTHFSFLIDSNGSGEPHYGDGLAFFLSPIGSSIKSWSYGGSLGLGNSATPVSSSSLEAFVAVEFDTFRNIDYDPAYSPHVGIDINSMRSVMTAKWENNISYGVVNDVWISYNASSKMLRADFTGHTSNVTQRGSLSYEVDLRDYLPEYVTVGFSAATGAAFETHNVKSWEFSSVLQLDGGNNSKEVKKKKNKKTWLILIVGLCVGLLIVIMFIAFLWRWKKKPSSIVDDQVGGGDDASIDEELNKGSGPRKFSFQELVNATNDFAEKLGEGGFGEVFRGVLIDTNSCIAVKRVSKGSKQGRKEYEAEVKIISQVRHINLVEIIGWCHQRSELLLVYEFMPNGSLDSHLFRENPPLITWEKRYKIAQGVASALFYLHEKLKQYVVHRDIKSSNIMLDSDFNAKLGDFGLARLVDRDKDFKTTVPAGTPGYIDPEHWKGEKASKATDIYSLGIVLLEIACGRRAVDHRYPPNQVSLVEWVRQLDRGGQLLDAADPKLGLLESAARKVQQILAVGLRCAHPDSNQRPSIGQVVQDLEFELSFIDGGRSLGDDSGEV